MKTAAERGEGCEWNPLAGEPAYETDEHHKTSFATWSIGEGKNNIHLCESCAALPRFKRLRKRTRVATP